jgi:hypothetical protein
MENSTSDDTWDDLLNGTMSAIDVQMAHSDFELWDQMLFSNTGTLNGAMDPHSLADPIDNIIATSQSVHNNDPFPTGQLAPQINTLPPEDLSIIEDIKKE